MGKKREREVGQKRRMKRNQKGMKEEEDEMKIGRKKGK